jgi:hypothetical protein
VDDGYTILLGQDFVVGDETAFEPMDDLEHGGFLLIKISNWVAFRY